MASAFQLDSFQLDSFETSSSVVSSGFQADSFQVDSYQINLIVSADQDVALDVAIVELAPRALRVSLPNAPLIISSDQFLIIGRKIDFKTRRVTYVAEQIIFDPNVVLGLLFDERWEPNVIFPNRLIFDERWEPEVGAADLLLFDERWEPDITNLPPTIENQIFDERWET